MPHGFDWQEQKPASSVARVSGVIIPPAQWAYGVPLSILRGWDTRIFTLERTFDELKDRNIIYGFQKEVRRGKQNRIDDVLYTLMPSMDFVSEMKKANKRNADVKAMLSRRLITDQGRKNM